jgi:hypothetical protein
MQDQDLSLVLLVVVVVLEHRRARVVEVVTHVTRYVTRTRGLPVQGPGFARVRNLIPGPGPGPVPATKPAGLH